MTPKCKVSGILYSFQKQSHHTLESKPGIILHLQIGLPVLLSRNLPSRDRFNNFSADLPDLSQNCKESVQTTGFHQHPHGSFWLRQAVLPIMMNANAFVLGIAQGHFNHFLLTKQYQSQATTLEEMLLWLAIWMYLIQIDQSCSLC